MHRTTTGLALVLALGTSSLLHADDKWTGKTVLCKSWLTPFGHPEPAKADAATEYAIAIFYTVIGEKDNWLRVRELGVDRWLSRDEVVPLDRAVQFFSKAFFTSDEPLVYLYAARALAYQLKRDHDKALANIEAAIKQDAFDASLRCMRGAVLADLQRIDEAQKEFDAALEIDPESAGARGGRGIIHSYRGDFAKAAADLDEAVRLNPDDPVVRINRSHVRFCLGDATAAIKDVDTAIRLDDTNAEAFFARASLRMLSGDPRGAIVDFDRASTLAPENSSALYGRGLCRRRLGDFEAAIHDAAAAVRLNKRLTFALRESESSNWSGRNADGAKRENLDQSRACAEAIRKNPKSPWPHHALGMLQAEIGANDKAISELSEAIRLAPDNALALAQRGVLWRDQGHAALAIADFNEVIRLEPANHIILCERAIMRFRLGQTPTPEVFGDLNEALRVDPRYAQAYNLRGAMYFTDGKNDAAISDYDRGIALDPTHGELFHNRGSAWLAKKEYGRALKDYESAMRLAPNKAVNFSDAAWVLATCPIAEHRDGKRAVELARKACELTNWRDGVILARLTFALAEAGQFDEAITRTRELIDAYSACDTDLTDLRRKLKLFKARKPYRDE